MRYLAPQGAVSGNAGRRARLIVCAVLAAAAVAAGTARAAGTTVDFENLSQGAEVGSSQPGLVFSPGVVAVDASSQPGFAHSGHVVATQCLQQARAAVVVACGQPFTISFADPQGTVSLWTGYAGALHAPATVSLVASDKSGAAVTTDSQTLPASDTIMPIGLELTVTRPQDDIAEVSIETNAGGTFDRGFAIDDVSYGPAPTPPDLAISSVVQAAASDGRSIALSVRVDNLGAFASSPTHLHAEVQGWPAPEPVAIPELPGMQGTDVRIVLSVPDSARGSKQANVHLFVDAVVGEKVTDNNVKDETLAVPAPPPPPPPTSTQSQPPSPASTQSGSGGSDVPWAEIGGGVGGAVLLLGVAGFAMHRRTRWRRMQARGMARALEMKAFPPWMTGGYDEPAPAAEAETEIASPSAAGERQINTWISERTDKPDVPLQVGETYTLNLQVGHPLATAGVTAGGDATIAAGSIPPAGLDTEWVVTSQGAELRAASPKARPRVHERDGKKTWTVKFPLKIPAEGESDVRLLHVVPLHNPDPEIDVAVYAGKELYRQLTIGLNVEGKATEAAAVGADVAHAPAGELALRTTHEWTTPPGKLTILVIGNGDAYAKGDVAEGSVDTPTEWYGAPARVSGLIENVRGSAESFRAAREDYLNNVDADELERRLKGPWSPQYSWVGLQDRADADHEAAWTPVATSGELRTLAFDGHRLYEAFFPADSDLRKWLDTLTPGHRVDISWLDRDPDWIPQVPWGLMYRSPAPPAGRPVDPMEFLGLRFRLGYTSHQVPVASKSLGSLATSNRSYLLYWADNATDPITVEANRQRVEWAAWQNQHFLPAAWPSPDPKPEVVAALESPAPSPVTLIYLYCQCAVGDGNKPVLRFANSIQPNDLLDRTELGSSPLADRPLVFANACTTASSDPYMSNELQDGFFARNCRAFLGTETKVPIELASRFASIFFQFFYRQIDPQPMAAGEAVAQTRLFLWTEYRNIGGLFYAYVNQYELFVCDPPELETLRR